MPVSPSKKTSKQKVLWSCSFWLAVSTEDVLQAVVSGGLTRSIRGQSQLCAGVLDWDRGVRLRLKLGKWNQGT